MTTRSYLGCKLDKLDLIDHACQAAACSTSPLREGCNALHLMCRVLLLAQAMRGRTGSAGRDAC